MLGTRKFSGDHDDTCAGRAVIFVTNMATIRNFEVRRRAKSDKLSVVESVLVGIIHRN